MGVHKIATRVWSILCLAALASGCAQSTHIDTNKAPDYSGAPRRMFIFSYTEGDFTEEFNTSLNGALVRHLKECGVAAEVTTAPPASPAYKASLDEMRKFGPDSILTIARAGSISRVDPLNHPGGITATGYDLQLFDVPSSKMVWRANAVFHPGPAWAAIGDRAKTLASELTDRMESDGILQFCTPSSSID